MRLIKIVDRISEVTGAISAWLVIPLMLVVIYEVIMRKLFNAPTGWGYDICWMLFAAQFLIGGAFTLLRKGHIRIDILYGTLSERGKQIYDTAIYLIMIFPVMALFTWSGIVFAAEAWMSDERLSTTNWFFPAGPSKTLIPLGFFLLGLQCLVEIIRNLVTLRKGKKDGS